MHGGVQRREKAVDTHEIRATIIDHEINHGLFMRETGERVLPNLRWSIMASIIQYFQQINRQVMYFTRASFIITVSVSTVTVGHQCQYKYICGLNFCSSEGCKLFLTLGDEESSSRECHFRISHCLQCNKAGRNSEL